MTWKTDSLKKLFNPESIAVIGASDKPQKLGGLTLRALNGYGGKIYPVNPRLKRIGHLECYSGIKKIEEPIDLALIALGPLQILEILKDCSDARVKSAIIFSAGFKELGQEGKALQEQVKSVANSGHIAVIGPNCLGAGNVHINLNATFFPHPVVLEHGNVSLVSQSGGVAGLMIYAASDSNVGVAKFASIGNRVNIDFHDMLHFLSEDDETKVICLFVEGTEFGREFYDMMSNVSHRKHVIVYKVGKTPVSRAAALSHTGSLAGNYELYSAAIKQANAIETFSVQEMIDAAKVLSVWKTTPKGKRVAIVTHTLGPALISAQILEENGIELPVPSKETASAISDLLGMPIDIPISNPVDVLAQGWAKPEIFANAFRLIINESRYDAVMTVFSPNYQEDIGGGMPIDPIIQASKKTGKPVVAVLNSPECKPPIGRESLEQGGIPVFSSPERAALATASAAQFARFRE